MNALRPCLHFTPAPTLIVLAALLAVSPVGPAVYPAGAQEPDEPVNFAQGRSPAHTHVHHVSVTFRGTPENQGLLATAVAEAEIAQQHATLAMRDATDTTSVRRHVGHVLHALDPSATDGGPGLGYGAVRAAERTAHYISLASVADGATDAIQTHSTHIATAARHAMSNGEAAHELATEILAATAPPEEDSTATEGEEPGAGEEPAGDAATDEETEEEEADTEEPAEGDPAQEEEDVEERMDVPAAVAELVSLTQAIVEGVDADGDGRVGWQEGEGGLAQATQHLQLLRRAEGLTGS